MIFMFHVAKNYRILGLYFITMHAKTSYISKNTYTSNNCLYLATCFDKKGHS